MCGCLRSSTARSLDVAGGVGEGQSRANLRSGTSFAKGLLQVTEFGLSVGIVHEGMRDSGTFRELPVKRFRRLFEQLGPQLTLVTRQDFLLIKVRFFRAFFRGGLVCTFSLVHAGKERDLAIGVSLIECTEGNFLPITIVLFYARSSRVANSGSQIPSYGGVLFEITVDLKEVL